MSAQTSHIIFLHIPKAGGTTLRSVLQSQYAERGVFVIGEDVNGDIIRFKTMPAEQRERIALLMGHMSHGLHQFFHAPVTYLTMLRNPVDRVFSEYRFLSSNRYHPLYKLVHGLKFEEYLALDPTRQGSNGQTRLLSGMAMEKEIGIPGIRPVEERDFLAALENLKKYYPLVGLLEKFDETLVLWRRFFGWRWPFYVKKNITIAKDARLSESAAERIRSKNRYDLQLYKEAATIFESQMSRQPRLFRKQVSLFRMLNRIYQDLRASYSHIRRAGSRLKL